MSESQGEYGIGMQDGKQDFFKQSVKILWHITSKANAIANAPNYKHSSDDLHHVIAGASHLMDLVQQGASIKVLYNQLILVTEAVYQLRSFHNEAFIRQAISDFETLCFFHGNPSKFRGKVDNNEFYDAMIAPALRNLAGKCAERKMTFLAATEYYYGHYALLFKGDNASPPLREAMNALLNYQCLDSFLSDISEGRGSDFQEDCIFFQSCAESYDGWEDYE